MNELIFDRIENKLSENFEQIPQTLKQNKYKFCQMMLKNPKIQKFYAHFNDELTKIVETEIYNNKDTIGMFLLHPHAQKLNSLAKINNKEKEERLRKEHRAQVKINKEKEIKTKMKEKIEGVFKDMEAKKNLNFVEQATAASNKKKYSDFQMELIMET